MCRNQVAKTELAISRLEPELLNIFQENLIYLLLDWPFQFSAYFHLFYFLLQQ